MTEPWNETWRKSSRCPDLFIEAGLHFVRRQIVLNGRRPDILFEDVLSRHLLVELQRGKLDEEHLQRHVYYFYDYRAKYPETHPRLMFLANRVIPQHKEFLQYPGYEYKEIPEREFSRRWLNAQTWQSVLTLKAEKVQEYSR
jgi:hypothetical protein